MSVPDTTEPTAHRSFPRSASCLPEIFDFIDAFFADAGIGERHRFPIHLAVEEWFTNLVKYSQGGVRDIRLELKREAGRLAVSLTDFDVPKFDIRAVPDVDVTKDVRERKPGGLGVHLLKQMVDDVGYEYVDGRSTTTFFKALE
jgi:serine/threonine-protein kinase RsbW